MLPKISGAEFLKICLSEKYLKIKYLNNNANGVPRGSIIQVIYPKNIDVKVQFCYLFIFINGPYTKM